MSDETPPLRPAQHFRRNDQGRFVAEHPQNQTYARLTIRGGTYAGPWVLFEMDGTWVFVHEQERDIVPLSAVDIATV